MVKNIILLVCLALAGCKGISQDKEIAKSETKSEETFEITKSDAEWRAQLDDMQYYVLRKAGTESAFTSYLLNNKEEGVYVCGGCQTPLFKSDHKFDSGTGWPSFDQEIEGNVAYDTDYKIGYARTEEHCAKCGGHLGHVFNDGPRETTGQRYCINSLSIGFEEEE